MDGEGLKQMLEDLERDSIDRYMRLCFSVLMAGPKEMLEHTADIDLKLKGIDKLITYFKEKEEYEKCTDLQNLKHLL